MYNLRRRQETMTVKHASSHAPVQTLLLGVTVATSAMAALWTRDADAQCQYDVAVVQGPWCGDFFGYPPTRGHGINEAGDVAGYYTTCDLGPNRAFVWTADAGLVTLNIPGASQSWANDIGGQLVAGWFDPGSEFGAIAFVSDGASALPIPPPPGGFFSQALGINENEQVVVMFGTGEAFLWQDGDFTLIGPFEFGAPTAWDVNNLGQVVGWTGDTSQLNPTARAFITCGDGEAVSLPAIPGGLTSVGQATNDNGQVVGFGLMEGPELATHGFIWSAGTMTDIGTLPGFSRSFALGINDRGTVAGYCTTFEGQTNVHRAFIWQSGQMIDLNDLLSSEFEGTIIRARAINNRGQITGDASTITGIMAVLLTPVESPVGDINGDCQVGIVDFLLLLGHWGVCPTQGACVEDVDGDGVVGIIDFLLLLANWG